MRGIAGAVLLMVPVVVAGAIGLGGGVGVGLTSFTNGPRDPAVNSSGDPATRDHRSTSLDTLAGSIPPAVKREDNRNPLGVPEGPGEQGGGGSSNGPGAITSPPAGSGSGGSSESGGPSNAEGTPAASAGIDSTESAGPPATVDTPASSSNPLADLLNGLLGGGSPTGP